jgi:hypothetical protein
MSIAVLNFKDLTIPGQVTKTRNIINHTENNIDFPNPVPTIAAITSSVNLLESIYLQALNDGHRFVRAMDVQEKKHYALMMLFVGYVQDESGGEKIKILSTALEVKKRGGKSKRLDAVTNLRQLKWGREGEVRMRWDLLKGARSFVSQTSANWNKGWKYTDFAGTKATLVIGKLVHESYVWVRIAGINSMGIGAWSNPVRVRV